MTLYYIRGKLHFTRNHAVDGEIQSVDYTDQSADWEVEAQNPGDAVAEGEAHMREVNSVTHVQWVDGPHVFVREPQGSVLVEREVEVSFDA